MNDWVQLSQFWLQSSAHRGSMHAEFENKQMVRCLHRLVKVNPFPRNFTDNEKQRDATIMCCHI